MFQEAVWPVNVFPAKEQKVLLQNRLNKIRVESLADRAPMFVMDDARGLVEDFPTTLPRKETEIGVLKIERSEKRIEATKLEEFSPIERA